MGEAVKEIRKNIKWDDESLHCLWAKEENGIRVEVISPKIYGDETERVNLFSTYLLGANIQMVRGNCSVFYGGQHQGVAACTHISIGCERHTHAEWRRNYTEIGLKNGYTDAEIERYRAWIFSLDWLMEGMNNE